MPYIVYLEGWKGVVCLFPNIGVHLRAYLGLVYITATFCDVKVYFSIVYVFHA